MARLLQHVTEEPRTCSYLPDRQASLEHRILIDMTSEELEGLLVRGWRRFGPDYFRPSCASCNQCVPIRIPTAAFAPSKSQRRARRNGTGLRATLGAPVINEERLALYHRWHSFREQARDWAPAQLDMDTYFITFAFPHPSVREIAYYDDHAGKKPRLVGVGICDVTPNAWSAVYFYYDPEYAGLSPGVGHIMTQVDLARARGIGHVYLGYWVAGCPSMQYKSRFHPLERLIGWPEPGDEARWVPLETPQGAAPASQLGGGTGTSSSG